MLPMSGTQAATLTSALDVLFPSSTVPANIRYIVDSLRDHPLQLQGISDTSYLCVAAVRVPNLCQAIKINPGTPLNNTAFYKFVPPKVILLQI